MRIITKKHPYYDEASNTYIIEFDDNSVILVDPGSDNEAFLAYLDKSFKNVLAVLLTHGHYDHTKGVKKIKDYYNCPVYIHALDERFIKEPRFYEQYLLGLRAPSEEVNDAILVSDNEVLTINNLKINVIHTPFHTKGSVCYYVKELNALFSGDTLFKGSVGRTDLIDGDQSKVTKSLNKLKELPKETIVYPGHDDVTTIGNELLHNPYFQK